jgi:NADH-quinone oxidoreductase subunit E
VLSDRAKAEITRIRARYPHPRSALMPALSISQKENGWLSPEAMAEVAEFLDVPPVEAAAVASFYTMYRLKPTGEYLIQICTNISCSLLGAEHLVEYISRKLGIKEGEITPDGKFTWIAVQCLGSCGTAPMMQINDDYYENLTEEKIDQILTELASK